PKDRDHPDDRAVDANRQIERSISVGARKDPERDSDQRGDEHATNRQFHGRGEANRNLMPNRLPAIQLSDRIAKVPCEHVSKVHDILYGDRLIKPQLLACGIDRRLRRIATAPEGEDRIPRQDSQDDEDGREENQEHRNGQEDPRYHEREERSAAGHARAWDYGRWGRRM